jgi:carboxyl-terminal processing protease
VQVRDRNNNGYEYKDQDPSVIFDGNVVVLVNSFSASAAEIVSAALQDYGRAIIIGGSHTYGKGTVQTVLNLDSTLLNRGFKPGTGSIKVTTQKYFRVTGGSTQFKGVEPDIVLPDVSDYLDIGEKTQSHSLSWSTTSATAIEKWNPSLIPNVVRERSQNRVKTDPTFMAMTQLINKLKARRKESSYPLNLVKAIAAQKESKKESTELDQLKITNSPLTATESDKTMLANMEPERATEYKEWLTQITKDIYINEAATVLTDLLTAQSNGAH